MIIIPRRHIDPAPEEWRRLMTSGTTGHDRESVQRWEKAFADHIGCGFGVAVGSGRLAMRLLLTSLELPRGAEIIIPAYTLKDLIPIITSLGLVPVVADIDPEHWNINAATVAAVLTEKTKAIIVLHLFGNPAPMLELQVLAKANDLKVIEDCAHSAGSTFADKPTGSAGVGAFFSFESIKPINTYGGGMVVTDDPGLAALIRSESTRLPPFSGLSRKIKAASFEHLMFKSGLAFFPLAILSSPHGQRLVTRLYRHIQPPPSIPYGYSGLQAELGIKRLANLAVRVAERQRQAALLTAWLPSNCRPQKVISGGAHNYYFFVIRYVGDALRLRRHLLFHGFDAGFGPEIADDCSTLLPGRPCPNAYLLQKQALHLPLHEGISDRQLARMAEIITEQVKE
jgi:dTDP-4-amino-4,6-dideoxygalactose transaminase